MNLELLSASELESLSSEGFSRLLDIIAYLTLMPRRKPSVLLFIVGCFKDGENVVL